MNWNVFFTDVLMCVGVLMYFTCFFLTRYTLAELSTMTAAANQMEADPVTRQIVDLGYFSMGFMVLTISFLAGIYYLLRRKYLKEPTEAHWQILSFFAFALMFLFLHNIMNDLPIVLKLYQGVNI